MSIYYNTDVDNLYTNAKGITSSNPFLYKVINSTYSTTDNLSSFKNFLNISFDDEDTFLKLLLESSFMLCEKYTGKDIAVKAYTTYRDYFFNAFYKYGQTNDYMEYMTIEKTPFMSLTSIEYLNKNNEKVTLASDIYYIQETAVYPFIALSDSKSFPNDVNNNLGSIEINFNAGMPKIPSDLLIAVFAVGANLYANRGDDSFNTQKIPLQAMAILDKYKLIVV